tara:strand:- start:3265 stop:3732 length:468 start_codon:yes stop_codon:yes gene_type:complete
MPSQVYLSKSKAGDFNTLVEAKSKLKKFDIDLVEFMGGRYTTRLLDSSDCNLILPMTLSLTKSFKVGRGQWEEYLRSSTEGIKTFAIVNFTHDDVLIVRISNSKITALGDWAVDYGTLGYDTKNVILLSDIYPLKKTIVLTEVKPMLAILPTYLK